MDEPKKEPPAVTNGGTPLGTRTAKITDKRPGHVVVFEDAGADASP